MTKYYQGYQINEDKIGGRCILHGGNEKCVKNIVTEAERKCYFGNLSAYVVDSLFNFRVFHNYVLLNCVINPRLLMNRNKY
jgi:hypothetical protein